MKKNKPFTLIELLIVVAIIGILVSILAPSLSEAREKARIAVCMSNQKQLVTAYQLYATTNRNYAVVHSWYRDFVGKTGSRNWGVPGEQRPLNKYAAPEIGMCPSDKGAVNHDWNKNQWETFGNSYFTNYAATSNIGKATNFGRWKLDKKTGLKVWKGFDIGKRIFVTRFDRPDRKIVFYNSNLMLGKKREWDHPSGKAKYHSQKNPKYPVSFIDGHVEYFNFSWKLTPGYYPKGNMDWLIDNLGYY
jgi:prepilin-type N-terminal cleavage/methylation domain-containing protein